MLLSSLVLIPIIGIVTIVSNNFTIKTIKYIALTTSIVNLFISLLIFILFDFSTNQFQFVQEHSNISYFDFYLGIDGLSIYFVLLTTIIIPISLLSNWKSIVDHVKSYIIIILLLESLLLLVFLVLDILLFYIFFESILPPLYILIGIFGSDNKIKASFYLFLYTLLGSLFLLLSIIAMSSIMSATDFDTLFKKNFFYLTQMFLFYGVFIAFAVKTPTIFLNTWLLKAHVESPLGGSIILAAIVLKLSLYGILRLILPILPKAFMEYTYIIFVIGVITIIYASISTLRTIDVKELIAYSSVSHAAVYLVGSFSNNIQGIEGSISLGLGHGFVSPGLFIVAGGVLYDRFHTRLLSFYKGMAQQTPLLVVLFFILCLANCGAPLTLNFIGEFLSLYGVFERSSLLGAFASSSIVFSAAYTIYMYQRISFGGRHRLAAENPEAERWHPLPDFTRSLRNFAIHRMEPLYIFPTINKDEKEMENVTINNLEGFDSFFYIPHKERFDVLDSLYLLHATNKIGTPDINERENVVLLLLVLFTIVFGIYPLPILDGIHYSVSCLLYIYDNGYLVMPSVLGDSDNYEQAATILAYFYDKPLYKHNVEQWKKEISKLESNMLNLDKVIKNIDLYEKENILSAKISSCKDISTFYKKGLINSLNIIISGIIYSPIIRFFLLGIKDIDKQQNLIRLLKLSKVIFSNEVRCRKKLINVYNNPLPNFTMGDQLDTILNIHWEKTLDLKELLDDVIDRYKKDECAEDIFSNPCIFHKGIVAYHFENKGEIYKKYVSGEIDFLTDQVKMCNSTIFEGQFIV